MNTCTMNRSLPTNLQKLNRRSNNIKNIAVLGQLKTLVAVRTFKIKLKKIKNIPSIFSLPRFAVHIRKLKVH